MGSGDCLEAMHFRALTSRARILYFIALSISQWCFSNLCWSNRFSFRWSAGEDYGTDIIRLEEFFTTGKNQRAILKDQPFALFRKKKLRYKSNQRASYRGKKVQYLGETRTRLAIKLWNYPSEMEEIHQINPTWKLGAVSIRIKFDLQGKQYEVQLISTFLDGCVVNFPLINR